jgi:hypothetical protein
MLSSPTNRADGKYVITIDWSALPTHNNSLYTRV